jgi:predicted O-methyltransferase YrrM
MKDILEYDLATFLGVGSPDLGGTEWLMYPSERLCLVGLLDILRPVSCLELGCRKGGGTRVLSQFSKHVVTVDLDPFVLEVGKALPNVNAICIRTDEALPDLKSKGHKFDFALVDADHSRMV